MVRLFTKSRPVAPFLTVLLLISAVPGCLVTRTQLKNQTASPTPVTAEIEGGSDALDELKGEITRLTGRLEEMERLNSEAAEAKAATETSDSEKATQLQARMEEFEKAQVAILEKLKFLESRLPPPDPDDLLKKGRASLKAGDHDKAIGYLTEYLGNSKAKEPWEAYLLRGQAYFDSKQYKKAIVDYSKFPEKYHRSRKMPEALLKIAQSFDALGMKDDAKGFYQEIITKFPKSSEARQARRKLK